MKIVINACFGGFGLSEDAIRFYADRKGLTLYPEKSEKSSLVRYWTKPKGETRDDRSDALWDSDIDRNDPDLVATIEALGAKANRNHAQLTVVEIPDGVDWQIDEYDGNEHIAEKHRTWP